MKYYRYPVLGALMAFLLVSIQPIRGDSPTIISEWDASIQFIPTEDFLDWPGIDSRFPVDVSAEAGRIWLIWPEGLVSLDDRGKTDSHSLLALFSSAAGKGSSWSPEGGLMCSDGIWRSVDPEKNELVELNPATGISTRRPLNDIQSGILFPAGNGNILSLEDQRARMILSGAAGNAILRTVDLASNLPPLTLAAASRELPYTAWIPAGSSTIQIREWPAAGETDQPGLQKTKDIAAEGILWAMDWAGPYLVTAGPGKLTALQVDSDDRKEVRILEDSRLPRRWYRIRGGGNSLLIHSPETQVIALVKVESDSSDTPIQNQDFSFLLKTAALEAGRSLEDDGLKEQAIAYYSWILPLVRQERSRSPLSETWPVLEREITDRRARLSGNW